MEFGLLVLVILAGCLFGLAVDWVLWKGYLFVAAELFPGSTSPLAHPGFWVFVVASLILGGVTGGFSRAVSK